LFLIIFTPLAYGAIEPWGIVIFELTAAFMALVWFLKMLANGKIEYVKNPLNPLILAFIFYICLQLFFSRNTQYAILNTLPHSIYLWATKTELLKITSYGLFFFVILNTIKAPQQVSRILSYIIAAGFIFSLFYLMRYFGVKAPRGLINRDHFSAYLGMIIPIALGLLFAPSVNAARYSLTAKRFLLFFFVIIMGAALFFTMSRGGMFSFILALLFVAVLVSKRRDFKSKKWVLSIVFIFIALTIVWIGATPVIERIFSIKVEIASLYFGGRMPIWKGTIDIIRDYFIYGSGLGTFNYIFPKYQPSEIASAHYTYAHSDFLELLSEVGIVGFFIFVSGIIVFAVCTFRQFNIRRDSYVIGMSIGIFGSLMSIFLHSFTDFNLHIPANAIMLSIILPLSTVILNSYYGPQNKRYETITINHKSHVSVHNSVKVFRYGFLVINVLAILFYGAICVKPAIADYYFKQAKKVDVPLYAKRYTLNAIKFDPSNAEYHYELAKSYYKNRKLNCSLEEYKTAVKLNPTNSRYHQSLAWINGQLAVLSARAANRYSLDADEYRQKAISEFKTAIELEPNNSRRYSVYSRWVSEHGLKNNNSISLKKMQKANWIILKNF
jgi:O-antigen ligase